MARRARAAAGGVHLGGAGRGRAGLESPTTQARSFEVVPAEEMDAGDADADVGQDAGDVGQDADVAEETPTWPKTWPKT